MLELKRNFRRAWRFSLSLILQLRDNKPTTYEVTASFEGDQPQTKTAYFTFPNGTQYPVCTTIQYEYLPSHKSTTITVQPQSSEVVVSTKTPEEMEEEAKQKGWLRTWHQFTWWYPWYRLHFVAKYDGEKMIDVGVAVFPGADKASFLDTPLKRKIDEAFRNILSSIIVGMIVGEAAVWVAGNIGPWAFAVAIIGFVAYKFATLWANWDSVEKLWEYLIANFISTVISAFKGLCQFLPSAFRTIAAGIANIKNWAFAFIYKCIMLPLNIYLLITIWDRLVALGGV